MKGLRDLSKVHRKRGSLRKKWKFEVAFEVNNDILNFDVCLRMASTSLSLDPAYISKSGV